MNTSYLSKPNLKNFLGKTITLILEESYGKDYKRKGKLMEDELFKGIKRKQKSIDFNPDLGFIFQDRKNNTINEIHLDSRNLEYIDDNSLYLKDTKKISTCLSIYYPKKILRKQNKDYDKLEKFLKK